MDCSHTRPVPRSVARNRPSPPNTIERSPPACWMSKSMPGSKATTQPVSTRRVSLLSCFSMTTPPAWMNASPSPRIFCSTNPSPPKKPAPNLRLKWMEILVPKAAHRKLSFWAISVLPGTWPRLMGSTVPGYGAANATLLRAAPRLVKCVMNSDSPVSSREPTFLSIPMKPLLGAEPSPILVSYWMPSCM